LLVFKLVSINKHFSVLYYSPDFYRSGYESNLFIDLSFPVQSTWSSFQGSPAVEPWQSAVCGAFAGGTAAALTTPLDVAKTRIMLAQAGATEVKLSIPQLLVSIGRKEGIRG